MVGKYWSGFWRDQLQGCGLVWLKIQASDRHLWTQYWNFSFHKMGGNFFTSWKIIFSKNTLFHGVRLCFHANDNYILSPPPAFSTVPFIISVLITVCSRTHAHKLVKLSPIFPLSLQVEWRCTNWVSQMCIIFTIYIHPVCFYSCSSSKGRL